MHREIGLTGKKEGVKLFLIAITLFFMVVAAISFADRTDFAAITENPTNEMLIRFSCGGGML